MKGKSLGILAAVVILLGAFIWFFERHQPTSDEARAYEARIFGHLNEDDVVAMNVTNAHGAFSFQRTENGWRLTQPIELDADASAVDGALSALVGLDRERDLGPDEVDPKIYGLDNPSATITLQESNGRVHTLTIGDSTPLDSERAVSIDQKSVILTDGKFVATLVKDLDGWRSREVCDVNLDQLAAVTVRTKNGTIEASNLAGAWNLHTPVVDRADRTHLQSLAASLTALRVEEFVDADTNPALLGLATPQTSVLLVMADGSSSLSLEFGLTRGNTGSTEIACRRNQTDVFWVKDSTASTLGKAGVLWRDPKVLAFDTWDVAGLILSDDSTGVQLTKANGLWLLADGTEVESDEVQKRISALAQLKVVDFDLMNIGTPVLGRVKLALNSTESPIEITFFEPLEDGGNILVSASGRNAVMSVITDDVQSILGNLPALRPAEPEASPPLADQDQTL